MQGLTLNVLFVTNHAPDYRESFLRELGGQVENLTVVAQPCSQDGLADPDNRLGYTFVEIPTFRFMGFYWQPGLRKLLHSHHWDILCFDIDLRQLARIYLFITSRKYWRKWIWRGLVFGRSKLKILGLIRRYLFRRSAGCLVYSEEVAKRVRRKFGVHAISFNNTEIKRSEFRKGNFDKEHSELRLLFVGTYKQRKKLERLADLVSRRDDVIVKIVGPGMEKMKVPFQITATGKIDIVGRKTGAELNPYFDWADLVVSPGNVGLLVMNAARHGKGIVIDNNSMHGPEYLLAKESGQPFVSFANAKEVDFFVDKVLSDRRMFKVWGGQLQSVAKEQYTIEHMADVHMQVFYRVAGFDGVMSKSNS
ncbi:MAG: glycosyltransferase [Desulfobulbaceae bacterium]|nr:glycosyltransferase [Desulfobulbaceae bacterium]